VITLRLENIEQKAILILIIFYSLCYITITITTIYSLPNVYAPDDDELALRCNANEKWLSKLTHAIINVKKMKSYKTLFKYKK